MIFVGAIILGVVAIVAFIVAAVSRGVGALLAGVGALVLALVVGIFSVVTTVPPGSVGVVSVFGSVNDVPIDSGLHMVNPFAQVTKMSVMTDNYWMSSISHEGAVKGDDSVSVRSSNGLQMPVDVSVPYRLIPDTAPWVLKNLGTDYIAKVLRPALSTATRRAASQYTAEELYSSKRDEFANKTKALLDEEILKLLNTNYQSKEHPEAIVIVSQVLIGHVGIPDTVKNAIEAKLKADQEQQAMEFQILKAKKEAERKRIEAEGIQKFQDIVSKGIDERLLRWKAIEATLSLAESNNAKLVIIGSGKDGLPVLLNSSGEPMIPVKP